MQVANSIRAAALTFLLAFSVVGCTTLNDAYQAATGTTVNSKAVYVSASTVDAIVVASTQYLKQPRCTGNNGPVCRSPAATKAMAPLLRTLVSARQKVVQYAIDHPGTLGDQGLYDAMQVAYQQLKDTMTIYGIATQ